MQSSPDAARLLSNCKLGEPVQFQEMEFNALQTTGTVLLFLETVQAQDSYSELQSTHPGVPAHLF